jgi:tetratricopeptide (TPR) repeat protein
MVWSNTAPSPRRGHNSSQFFVSPFPEADVCLRFFVDKGIVFNFNQAYDICYMGKGLKFLLGLVVLLILLALVVSWYPSYQAQRTQKNQIALDNKIAELNALILEGNNCDKVIEEVTTFLKRNTGSADIWSFLGACQFDLGQFEEAKNSFQKVLSFNPDHEGAKNYLKQMDFKTGEVVVTATELPLDKAKLESRLGFNLDGVLNFERAVERPSNIPEYFLGYYTSTTDVNKVVTLLEKMFRKININFLTSEIDEGNTVYIDIFSNSDSNERKTISIKKTIPVQVLINYKKLE